MQYKLSQSTMAAVFTICLFSISQTSVQAAPGNLGQTPLFVAAPVSPNIFFMLDDSGSMNWNMSANGVSDNTLIDLFGYDTNPDDNREWQTWCSGANFMAYDSTVVYKPWDGTLPGTTTAFPDQVLTNVWPDPLGTGTQNWFRSSGSALNHGVQGDDNQVLDLSGAPVVTWTDNNPANGVYDAGECPGGDATTGFLDPRVRLASSLSATEQINFANWFTYYRNREHATKAAVARVVGNSTARMGMSTLHNNNGVGIEIKDVSVAANKKILMDNVVQMNSGGGTPLRVSLDNVGKYFDQASSTPAALNISTAGIDKPILSVANGGECQQNFTMLMTDGQWNGGDAATASVADQDITVDNSLVFPAHKDLVPNTLADIAMKWYKTDLATGYLPKVPVQTGSTTVNLDENAQQHMVTFGVAFGPTGTVTADPVDRTLPFVWPTPTSNSIQTVDDLRHAAYNGRGQFLSANNPETLITSLQTVIADIVSRQGSGAAVSFNTTSLVAGTAVFFASFDTIGWQGNVRALSIDPVTGVINTASPLWQAAPLLDAKLNADIVNRPVYTWGTDAAAANNGVLFNWSTVNPQLATTLSDDFKKNQNASIDVGPFTATQARVNFMRGDTSQDGSGLIRSRSSRLGDIIHSSPHFVGKPISNWPDSGNPFASYASKYSSYQHAQSLSPRAGMVYVGANDGMLHGFSATTGAEVFSYIPSAPASSINNDGLHYLTESDYQHRYYVDGSPVAADVYMQTEPLGSIGWRTILVGSLRGGGQGIYALNVTDPTQFTNTQAAAKNVVMWEFTNQDDTDLGFTFSDPQITMMNNGEWAVVIGNGYNATGTDNAKLMIIYIDQGVDGQWAATDYIKIDTGVGSAGNKNGLSTPTLVDLDSDGKTDRIYAGDLHGNLWVFDVSDPLAANWQIAHEDALTNKVPLFTATHHAGNPAAQVLATPTPQQITMKPLVIKPTWENDNAANTPNLMVYFGTGQYVATGDASNTDKQTFYGIWDAGVITASGPSVSATKLVEQTFLAGFPANVRVLSQNSVNFSVVPSSGDLGWFVNLPDVGERVVVNAFDIAGLIFFNTMIPSTSPCSAGGESFLMAVNLETGGNPAIAAFDVTGNRTLDTGDLVTDGSGNIAYAAGIAFGHGIASATAVVTNAQGKSIGVVSGTNSNNPLDYELPCDPTITSCVPGVPPTGSGGTRKSWLQLFN